MDSRTAKRFSAGVGQRIFRSDQRGTPDTAVGHPATATGLVQRTGLGGPAEVVVHGPDVAETAHVPRAQPRARAGRAGLGPGRDPAGRVRRTHARRQPERVEQQDRLGAEPVRGPGKPDPALSVQREPRAGQPAPRLVRGSRVRRLHRGRQPFPVRLSPVPVPGRPSVRQRVHHRAVHRQELLHIAAGTQRTARRRRQTDVRRQVSAGLVVVLLRRRPRLVVVAPSPGVVVTDVRRHLLSAVPPYLHRRRSTDRLLLVKRICYNT